MTTSTKAANEPYMIDFRKCFESFAEKMHPNDKAAQKICKYNTVATLANTMLVATIASFALACFSNFMVLGLALTVATGFLYLGFSIGAKKREFLELSAKDTWNPVLVQLNGASILFRCYSAPKTDAPKAEEKQPLPQT